MSIDRVLVTASVLASCVACGPRAPATTPGSSTSAASTSAATTSGASTTASPPPAAVESPAPATTTAPPSPAAPPARASTPADPVPVPAQPGATASGGPGVATGVLGPGSLGAGARGTAGTGRWRAPASTGTLDRELIRQTIHRYRDDVRRCYEAVLIDQPGLHGRVKIRFVVSPSGAVSSAMTEETTLNNQLVEGCISEKIMHWVFPKPQGGQVVVSYPFELQAVDGP